MSWQDLVLTLGQGIFIVLLTWVAVDKHTRINRVNSIMNSLVIGEFAHVYFSLGLYGAAVTEGICSLLWLWIAYNRATVKR